MLSRAKKLLPTFFTILISLALIGCGGEVKYTVDITEEELFGAVITSSQDVETYELDMVMDMEMSGESDGETIEMNIIYIMNGVVDNTNREMYESLSMEMDMGWMSQSMQMEMYLIGDTMYMNMSGLGVTEQWMKETTPGLWDEENLLEQQIDLLETADVEFLGSETVKGVDCYKVELVPDLEKLAEIAMQNMEEMYAESPFDLEEVLKSYSAIQWFAKDTCLPMKATMQMTMVMSSDIMGVPGEEFEMEMDVSTYVVWENYGEPVSIELPQEALEATEVYY